MANKTIATTAEEFRAKYGNKRFTSASAGKSVILNHLYFAYLKEEQQPLTPLYPDFEKIKAKVETYEDMNLYNAYTYFLEWIKGAFQTAVIVRDALKNETSSLTNVIGSIVSGEQIRHEANPAPDSMLSVWISTVAIDKYTPQESGFYYLENTRKEIERNIRYMYAYNSFIELIAEEMEIPELTFLQVQMKYANALIDNLNEVMSYLRKDVILHRAAETVDPETKAEDVLNNLTKYTPEYLKETLKNLEPIGKEPPPIPEDRITTTKGMYKTQFPKNIMSWVGLFNNYMSAYYYGRQAVNG